MRLSILCAELAVIWLIYFLFGVATHYDMPIWLTTFLVIAVDRATGFITTIATRKGTRISARLSE
ncbi:hypothetical protein [uncultured Tateyamaria sp.]|uniref:hypothetical protein n=1 Tax=uncultured Tateyamaria sp. TaxID=455651 RepID=UPI0026313B3D|nr:hypothetical protein [uncultured Tateyamaria sp.]